MNLAGYKQVRAVLDSISEFNSISPIPAENDDIRYVTVEFSGSLTGDARIKDALGLAGLLCDDGARQLSDNPALHLVLANLERIVFEDLNHVSTGEPSEYVGLNEHDAYKLADLNSKRCQTTEREHRYVPRPDHIWPGRLNFVVEDGIVKSAVAE